MKIRINPFLALVTCLAATTTLRSAVLTWDTVSGDTAVTGGAGDWNLSNSNWTADAGATNVSWPAASSGDDDAVFGGSGGAVTIGAAGVTANGITFDVAGYTLSGGTLTLDSLDPDGPDPLPAPPPLVRNDVAASIGSPLAGSFGLEKAGNGTLTLLGDNTLLAGPLVLSGATSGNNGGIVAGHSESLAGFTSIDIRNNSFLQLNGVVLGASVPITVAGGGGTAAPHGALRGGSGNTLVQGAVTFSNSSVRMGNLGTSTTFSGPVTAPVGSGFGLLIRMSNSQGTIFSNTGNYWEGSTVLGQGSVYFHPDALPDESGLRLAGSGSTWFESNGSFTRAIGSAAGQVAFDNLIDTGVPRTNGFSARGGDLTVNLGGSETPATLVWNTTTNNTGFCPAVLGLGGANSTGTVTFANPIDLGGVTRTFDSQNGSAAVDGRISGNLSNGMLAKSGPGTLALAGTNTLTAASNTFGFYTTAGANLGSLRLESDGALGGISVIKGSPSAGSSIGSGSSRALLELAGDVEINGIRYEAAGRSSQTTSGAALASISGDNVWNGEIRIMNTGGGYGIRCDSGTLTLAGRLGNSISSARVWELVCGGDIRITGDIQNIGAGSVGIQKTGDGTLYLLGSANSYTGTTTIAIGILQVGDGGTNGALGAGGVTNNADLVFDRDGNLTVSATINGTGDVVNRGPGIVNLSGAISHTGSTTVEHGTLRITGDASGANGPVAVGDASGDPATAILGGTGPIGGSVTLATDGALAPGTSVGLLQILGNATGNGRLAIEVDGATADQLAVGGTLNISSMTLSITSIQAPTVAEYVIASAGTLTGQFLPENVSGLPSGYHLDYSTPNQVKLVGTPAGYGAWAANPLFGLSVANQAADADPDNDGMKNLLEYVLNGNPAASDPTILPDLDASGANFVFTFTRRAESAADTTQGFQWGTTLAAWNNIPITGTPGAEVSFGTVVDGLQTVTVTIPKNGATSLFGRLQVTD